MTEAAITLQPSDKPVEGPIDPNEVIFAEALAAKLEQGYHLESQTKLDAVIFSKGRRKWFGLVEGAQGRRRRISLNPDGTVKTRGMD